jgi:hypothetical protein
VIEGVGEMEAIPIEVAVGIRTDGAGAVVTHLEEAEVLTESRPSAAACVQGVREPYNRSRGSQWR